MRKVAIVTGGTRGIGLEITRSLKNAGYQVAAIYAHDDAAAAACETSTGAKSYKLDVSNYEDCAKIEQQIEADLGPVDILVNNAGITRDGMMHKMAPADWHSVIETNLTSCFNMCHAVITGMRARGYGRIINISSINGQRGQMGQSNYAAAKAGILGFTKSLALESAAKGITVNAICPGYIETDMTAHINEKVLASIVGQIPAGRMGQPEEIAEMVVYLCSEKSGFINGSTFSINGGQYMAA
jgi:acetoacetyl-CoA reductase